MTNISCDVVKCVFNTHGGCSRNRIEIDESCNAAHKCCETYCGSFSDKMGSLKSSTCVDGCPCKESEVSCEATSCAYNQDKHCKAQGIHVGTSSSSTSCETECGTFKEKQ